MEESEKLWHWIILATTQTWQDIWQTQPLIWTFFFECRKIWFFRVLPSLPRSVSVCQCSVNKDWHEPSSVSGYKRFHPPWGHASVCERILSDFGICRFWSFKKKNPKNYATSRQEVMRQFRLSRLSRNTCGGWSSGGRGGPPLQVRLPRAAKG